MPNKDYNPAVTLYASGRTGGLRDRPPSVVPCTKTHCHILRDNAPPIITTVNITSSEILTQVTECAREAFERVEDLEDFDPFVEDWTVIVRGWFPWAICSSDTKAQYMFLEKSYKSTERSKIQTAAISVVVKDRHFEQTLKEFPCLRRH